MKYSQHTLKEPVHIRAHHLYSLGDYLLHRNSERASLAAWGDKAEVGNYNGYGREFVVNEARTWEYLRTNRDTRVKITDSRDVLCEKCEQRECSVPGPGCDEAAAELLGVEIGKEYAAEEIIGKALR